VRPAGPSRGAWSQATSARGRRMTGLSAWIQAAVPPRTDTASRPAAVSQPAPSGCGCRWRRSRKLSRTPAARVPAPPAHRWAATSHRERARPAYPGGVLRIHGTDTLPCRHIPLGVITVAVARVALDTAHRGICVAERTPASSRASLGSGRVLHTLAGGEPTSVRNRHRSLKRSVSPGHSATRAPHRRPHWLPPSREVPRTVRGVQGHRPTPRRPDGQDGRPGQAARYR